MVTSALRTARQLEHAAPAEVHGDAPAGALLIAVALIALAFGLTTHG